MTKGLLDSCTKDYLDSEFRSGLSVSELSKKLNVSDRTLRRKMKFFNIRAEDYQEFRPCYFENTIFDKIDTEEKAYWLGFLYADGHITKTGYSVQLSLADYDYDHVLKFKTFLNDSRKDSVIYRQMKKTDGIFHKESRYIVSNKHFQNQLINLGCVKRKSLILKFPDIKIFSEEQLVYDFIRGYVDGDGSLFEQNNCGRLTISIVGTYSMMEGISRYFPEFKRIESKGNIYRIRCSHANADKVSYKLYNNSSIYLDRKYKKFLTLNKLLCTLG